MPGLVALCHFCELHGPSVIMITQAIRDCQVPSADHPAEISAPCVPDQKMYGYNKLCAEEQRKDPKRVVRVAGLLVVRIILLFPTTMRGNRHLLVPKQSLTQT
eukprot:TRINITY_DN31559_c0_g1_i1.p1 TRINITY_DN31559_c0_g1~~TRINITY_DN31559_c0_g1_i1.p1  ORF type:complete len:103 (-),score=5.44 TRINITY_DN31559_c0_g1_i1:267-575(-)